MKRIRQYICTLSFLIVGMPLAAIVSAEPVRVAVAANFVLVAADLAEHFEQRNGGSVEIVPGASGLLASQIIQGAPYDVFLSADTGRPEKLVAMGVAEASTQRIYARGRLALWYPGGGVPVTGAAMDDPAMTPLAIANPRLAPYGAAAQAVLTRFSASSGLSRRQVLAENVSGVFTLVASGNAAAGFVALSQLKAGNVPADQYWLIPESEHPPIEQAAVLTRQGVSNPSARQFLQFIQSDAARSVMASAGYALPVKEN